MKKFIAKLVTLSWWKKAALVGIIILVGWGIKSLISTKNTTQTTVATTPASKGNLISSISASGSITASNTTNIATKASGTVTKVYVKNGDLVTKGQKLLDIQLDSDGIERRSAAWQAYRRAQEEVVNTVKDKSDLAIQIWQEKQAILDAHTAQDYKNNHPDQYTDAKKSEIDETVTQATLAFDVDAEKFAHADETIAAAKVSAQAAYLDYLDVSGSIVAPSTGIVNNLTLTSGSTLTASTSQSTTTGSTYASNQTIGFIRSANNQYQAKVSLTEADVIKVEAGQSVTITMDAYEDTTFTGKVLAVDVSGSSSSGVTAYPATILMDATELAIYPNMTVSATIITDIQTDVILIPTSAITTSTDGISTVQVMKDGKATTVTIEKGKSNDTQTIITSGLTEGDLVVTGSVNSIKNDNSSSAFSSSNSLKGGRSGSSLIMGGPPGM